MARIVNAPSEGKQRKSKTLQTLRKGAGFKKASDFADYLHIPRTTYSRYEQNSDGMDSRIPLKVAWVMADALECSIDMLVGRTNIEDREQNIQFFYDHLSKSSQQRFDEYMEYLQYRDSELGFTVRSRNRKKHSN